MIHPDWSRAACKGTDPALFFLPSGTASLVTNRLVAQMCDNCPIRETCLDYSLEHEKFGTWGGKSETQRRAIRRARGVKLVSPQSMVECRVESSVA